MALFFGNSYCKLCQSSEEQLKNELITAYSGMSSKGLLPAQNGYYSARIPNSTKIWKTQERSDYVSNPIPYFEIAENKNNYCDFENALHSEIYTKRPDINSIFHVRSYYSLYAIQNRSLETVHAEAALILGDIPIINYSKITSSANNNDLIKSIGKASIGEPLRPVRIIILQNNGVISLGACIHEARAFIEILEEWAKYKVISNAFGGTRRIITLDRLRDPGSRHARSIKFGGRQVTS